MIHTLSTSRFWQGLLGLTLAAALLAGCPQSGENTSSEASPSSETTSTESAAAPAETTDEGKGVGPVSSVDVAATVDTALAGEGKKVFEAKCTSCHKFDVKYVGPALQGVTQRRKPEWIMNMILNPAEMTQKDPEAKKLFGTFLIQMADQHLEQKQARAVLEYFRSIDAKK
ncbi:MAG: c-type cytochrome [Candidatus Sericytochromatia bacterium]